jgi:IS5 family transposase
METMLKKWRAGIEAVISNFMRGLNASICPWKGWEAFKCFVLWRVITFNLRVIAKFLLTELERK